MAPVSLFCYTSIMSSKAIKGGVIALAVIFAFLWMTVYIERPVEEPAEEVQTVSTPEAPSAPIYIDPSGFSVSYPEGYTVSTSTENPLFSNGVSFVVPEALTEGTNLSSDSRIYIEAKQGTSTCSAPASNADAAITGRREETTSFGGNVYRAVSYTEAGAGNFYETDIYAIQKETACYEIFRFIHTTNIGNYEPGQVGEFDRAKLDADLRIILGSFKAN
jgi:cytoskeletal protein RodZ